MKIENSLVPARILLIALLIAISAHSCGCASRRSCCEVDSKNNGKQTSKDDVIESNVKKERNKVVEDYLEYSIIHTDFTDKDIPAEWKDPRLPSQPVPLDLSEISRWKKIVGAGLLQYPNSVLHACVDTLFVVKAIKSPGLNPSGWFKDRVLFIAVCESDNRELPPLDVLCTLHHEMSSAVRQAFPDHGLKQRWLSVNPPAFSYKEWGALNSSGFANVQAMKDQGFVSEYATSSFENDYNTILEKLMTGDAEMWCDVETYSRIKAKVDLAMFFYRCVSPSFTEEYFQGLRSIYNK